MAETNGLLEVAKMKISASIKCNTIRGFIGWHSCDNICLDMQDVLDMCEDAFKQERYQESFEADTYVLVSCVKLASKRQQCLFTKLKLLCKKSWKKSYL